jgi:hypothetical protein
MWDEPCKLYLPCNHNNLIKHPKKVQYHQEPKFQQVDRTFCAVAFLEIFLLLLLEVTTITTLR